MHRCLGIIQTRYLAHSTTITAQRDVRPPVFRSGSRVFQTRHPWRKESVQAQRSIVHLSYTVAPPSSPTCRPTSTTHPFSRANYGSSLTAVHSFPPTSNSTQLSARFKPAGAYYFASGQRRWPISQRRVQLGCGRKEGRSGRMDWTQDHAAVVGGQLGNLPNSQIRRRRVPWGGRCFRGE